VKSIGSPPRGLERNLRFDLGAGIARKEAIVFRTSSSDPLRHRVAVELPTSITALFVPAGIVATNTARRGISALVDWERLL
jgi:hypothetical protein